MKRASYKEAVEWIVFNDPPDDNISKGHISVCLVADIFGVSVQKVLKDVWNKIEEAQ